MFVLLLVGMLATQEIQVQPWPEVDPARVKLGDFLDPLRRVADGIIKVANYADRCVTALERVGRVADSMDKLAHAADYSTAIALGGGVVAGLGLGRVLGRRA